MKKNNDPKVKNVTTVIWLSDTDSGILPHLRWDSLRQLLIDNGFQLLTILAKNSTLDIVRYTWSIKHETENLSTPLHFNDFCFILVRGKVLMKLMYN